MIRPDGRSREGRYVLRFRNELIKRLSRPPTHIEGILIDRAAFASLRLAHFDAALGGGRKTDDNKYLQWSNALLYALARLDHRDFHPDRQPEPWRPGPPLDMRPPGSTPGSRAMMRMELEILCDGIAPALAKHILALIVRIEHLVHTRIPGERWLVPEARRYHAMAHELAKAMDGLPRDRLVNTALECAVGRYSSDAAAILAEALAVL